MDSLAEKIRSLFSKIKEDLDKVDATTGFGEQESDKISWGIIIPHTLKAGGAETPAPPQGFKDRVNEYEYALEMAKDLPFPIATRNDKGIAGAAKELRLKGCNASLEPHLNAFNGQAKGFEILVLDGDSESLYYAEMLVESFRRKYPARAIRQNGTGIKRLKSGDRGYSNLIKAKQGGMHVALLSEAFFIDNVNDWLDPHAMAMFWRNHLS